MKRILGAILIFFITNTCLAHRDEILVDEYLSPYSGASYNITLYHSYMQLDDRYLPSTAGKEGVGWFMGRTVKIGLESVFSDVLMVLQHEVFGHGYRLREFGLTEHGYGVYIGTGYTLYDANQFDTLTYPERTALVAGGMEADSILAQEIRQSWILSNIVDRREATLYLATVSDQPEYILYTSDDPYNTGNDVNAYILNVNSWYGQTCITRNKLKLYTLVNYLDPSLYTGLYSIASYAVSGKPHIEMTTFDLLNYKYIFAPALLLSPYGPEFQMQNYLRTPTHKLWALNLRYGKNLNIQSYGADLTIYPIYAYEDWSFSNKLSVWRQPAFLQQNTAVGVANKLGGADFVRAEYKISQTFGAIVELGYKTAGYIPGVSLAGGMVWRAGFSIMY